MMMMMTSGVTSKWWEWRYIDYITK